MEISIALTALTALAVSIYAAYRSYQNHKYQQHVDAKVLQLGHELLKLRSRL
jgi:hypothetical protein